MCSSPYNSDISSTNQPRRFKTKIELNIGLNIADSVNTSWQRSSRAGFAINYLAKLGKVVATRREMSATEDTLIAVLDTGSSTASLHSEIERLAYELDQDCIAVLNVSSNAGTLVGSFPDRVAKWGEFNPEYFIRYEAASQAA